MPTPFEVHATTLSDYLGWLSAQVNSSSSDPNAAVPVFTWLGADYSCNYSLKSRKYIDAGGAVDLTELTLEALKPMPTPGPKEFEMVTFMEVDYRIQIVENAAGKNPKIIAWSPNRGA